MRLHEPPAGLQLALLAAAFALLLALAWDAVPRQPSGAAPLAELSFGEQVYRLPLQRLPALEQLTRSHFQSGERATLENVVEHLQQDIDSLFTAAHARVPELADWYYSLGGEYVRLLSPLLIRGGLLSADHLAERTEQMLFGDELLAGHLEAMRREVEDLLLEQHIDHRVAWQAAMTEALEAWATVVPAPDDSAVELDLDRFDQRLMGYDNSEFLTRMSLSSGAGLGAMAGPLIWRAASRRAVASGRVAASRGLARLAGRAGSAAAGGAVTCAPAGPAALGCALLAGSAAWLGSDWLLLRFDEARNREALEASLHHALTATRESLGEDLRQHYERMSRNRQQILATEIEYTFVPAYHRQHRTPGSDPS